MNQPKKGQDSLATLSQLGVILGLTGTDRVCNHDRRF
jgi:hypothetical protein